MNISKAQENSSGKSKAILADMVEAVIAAISLDSDIFIAKQFIISNFKNIIEYAINTDNLKDYKTTFQELAGKVGVSRQAVSKWESEQSLPDLEKITSFNIPIIEDISQSAGALYREKRAGTFGSFAILGLEERDILTGGGGGILIAVERRNASVLKNTAETIPITDFLPDINASLAFVQLKNMEKNLRLRDEMRELYLRALLQTRHKPLVFSEGVKNPVYSFPVILESGFKDVKQYVNRKDIDIELAFTNSIADFLKEENKSINAASLLLRTVLFPLYPRLGINNAAKIAKVLGTLP